MGKVTSEGETQGLLKVSENRVEYTLAKRKSYKLTDPEERVRASFCVELVRKYQYPKERIDLEVEVPRRKPTDKADIVVYADDELKTPYIVAECKPDGISSAEIKQAIEQAFGNAHGLGAKYAIVVAGNVRIAFDVAGFPPMEREKNIIADIPIQYGEPIKFRYKKGDPDWDIREVDKNEISAKFQQCHDTLWEAGKRNPAEAFDEMSKLMFCKIHDERFLTKKDQYYRFQVGTHEEIKEVAARVKSIYQDAQRIDPDVFVDPIKAEDSIIYGVIEILQGISLSQTDLDAKGVAFEHFLGAVFRGEMGQYFTPRPLVEFMVEMLSPDENDFVIDPACGSGGFLLYTLDKVKKDLEASLSPKDADYRWRNFGLKQLFGIEINSQLARVAMINMIIHEDGHSNIENNDGLDNPGKLNPRRDMKLGKYTLLLTNPPFGAVTKEREKPYLSEYELGGKIKKRNRQNTEILFIERCLDFLAPGGRMGIVLPDGVLTNSSLQYVRDFITEKAQILAVVSLPQISFVHYGSGVKASLVFLRKKANANKSDYRIFFAQANAIGYTASGKPDKNNDLPNILNSFKQLEKGKDINETDNIFTVSFQELISKRIDPKGYSPTYKKLKKNLSARYKSYTPLKKLLSNSQAGNWGVDDKKKKKDISYTLCYVLRNTNFDNYFNLDLADVATRWIKSEFVDKLQLIENDILVEKSGGSPYQPVGRVAIIDNLPSDKPVVFSNFLQRIRIDNKKASSKFVYAYLRTLYHLSYMEYIQNQTTGIKNLMTEDFEQIQIPLIEEKQQEEFANKLINGFYKAKETIKKTYSELLEVRNELANQIK